MSPLAARMPSTHVVAVALTFIALSIRPTPGLARPDPGRAVNVIVIPLRADVDGHAAEVAAGPRVHVRNFVEARLQLERADSAAKDAEAARLRRVEDALVAAQRAYLDQRFDDMVSVLGEDAADVLLVLGRPENRDLLWDLLFQRGLAHLRHPSREHGQASRASFLLALAMVPDRRPSRDVYGPDVERAFLDAVAARDRFEPRPVTLTGVPAGARVLVDGLAVLDPSRPLLLRDGPHLVVVTAIGSSSGAWIAEVTGRRLAVSVDVKRAASPAADLGPDWAQGDLSSETPSTVTALQRLAAVHHADVVMLYDAQLDGTFRARILSAAGVSPWMSGENPEMVVDAALAWLATSGTSAHPVADDGPPLWRRRWFLVGGAAVAVSLVVGAVILSADGGAERIHVVVR